MLLTHTFTTSTSHVINYLFYIQYKYYIPQTVLFQSYCLYEFRITVIVCLNSQQVNDSTHLVVLGKEEGSGLGFSVAGGVDLEQKAITVRTV